MPKARLELARCYPPPPQDGVSTNSTTSAYIFIGLLLPRVRRLRERKLTFTGLIRRSEYPARVGNCLLLGRLALQLSLGFFGNNR